MLVWLRNYNLRNINGGTHGTCHEKNDSITSEVTLEMHCNGVTMRRGFYVYPDLSEPMVLGTAFMQDFAGLLDFSTREFSGLPLDNRVPQDLTHAKDTLIKQIENDVFTVLVKTIEYSSEVKADSVDSSLFNLREYADVVTDHLPRTSQGSPYRLSLEDKGDLTKQIGQSLQGGQIEPYGSPYGAPVIL